WQTTNTPVSPAPRPGSRYQNKTNTFRSYFGGTAGQLVRFEAPGGGWLSIGLAGAGQASPAQGASTASPAQPAGPAHAASPSQTASAAHTAKAAQTASATPTAHATHAAGAGNPPGSAGPAGHPRATPPGPAAGHRRHGQLSGDRARHQPLLSGDPHLAEGAHNADLTCRAVLAQLHDHGGRRPGAGAAAGWFAGVLPRRRRRRARADHAG